MEIESEYKMDGEGAVDVLKLEQGRKLKVHTVIVHHMTSLQWINGHC